MTGNRYDNPESLIGEPGDGTFSVRSLEDVPYSLRNTVLDSVYGTAERSAADWDQNAAFLANLPKPRNSKEVFGYLNVRGMAKDYTRKLPISHAAAAVEKIGKFGRRQQVANLISVFVRPTAHDEYLGNLRFQGVGRATLHELLDQFDPEMQTAVLRQPWQGAARQRFTEYKLHEFNFIKRTIGGRDIYLGLSVQALQNQLVTPWINGRTRLEDNPFASAVDASTIRTGHGYVGGAPVRQR